jgi:2'-5' RNA ligase
LLPIVPVLNKYFIAIVPPEKILEKVEKLKSDLFEKHGLRGALRSPAHITLHRPFEFKTEKEKELIGLLEKIKPAQTLSLELKNFGCFLPRVIYIDVAANSQLYEFQQHLATEVQRNLRIFNQTQDMRGFHPHMTIAFRDLKKPKFFELWAEFQKKEFSEKFTVSSFSLLKLANKWEIMRDFNI